jgi:hypothetical protein
VKQASNYEIAADFIINHIKKEYDRGRDISETLRELERPDTNSWLPTLRTSTETEPVIRATATRQFEMEYKARLDDALRRTRIYEDNQVKSYALIWERCNTAMQNCLEQKTDFETTIYNDPIELLKAIKEHALNYQETRYEMSIIADAFRAIFNTKQRKGENLQEYTQRFKTSKEILESHIGAPIILKKYVESMPGYVAGGENVADRLINQSNEQFMAFIYLENSDIKKYGTVIKNLNSKKLLGNDQYPKTLIETNNVLGSHCFDSNKGNKSHDKS